MKIYLLIFFYLCVESRNLTRCELAVELLKQGFHEDQLRDWVCLVEAESSGRTDAIGGPDDDGSYDYGLFQINDRFWCSTGDTPGKGCLTLCQDLLKDDIAKASECAKKIHSIQGFEAWKGWVNECQNKQLPDITPCISYIRTILR